MLTWMVTLFIVCDTTLCASCSILLLIITMRWWRCRFLLRWRCTMAMMWRLKRWHIIHIAVAFAIDDIIAATITTTCGMLLLQIIITIVGCAIECIMNDYFIFLPVPNSDRWTLSRRERAHTHAHKQTNNSAIPYQMWAKQKKRDNKFRLMAMLILLLHLYIYI